VLDHYVFITAISRRGILLYVAVAPRTNSRTSVFSSHGNLWHSRQLAELYFGRFQGSFFFSYFLNAVSQPRQIEVSRWRFSSEYKEEVSPLHTVYSQSRRIRDIVCKAVDVYRKLSSKLKFEKLHIATSQERRRSFEEGEKHKRCLVKKKRKKLQCNDICHTNANKKSSSFAYLDDAQRVTKFNRHVIFIPLSLGRILSVSWEIKKWIFLVKTIRARSFT